MTETIAGGSPCEEDSLCGPQLSPSCGDHGAGVWRRHGGAVDHEVTSRAATCKHSLDTLPRSAADYYTRVWDTMLQEAVRICGPVS